MGAKLYDFAIIQSGRLIETQSFKEPICRGVGGGRKTLPVSGIVTPNDKGFTLSGDQRDYRREQLYKARRDIERLSFTNFDNGFTSLITLTYRENCTDIKLANRDFSKFIQRLKYVLDKFSYPYPGFTLKYICKPEFQERGAIHYHFVCNLRSFPFAKKNVIDWKAQGSLPATWDERYNLHDIWKGKIGGKGAADLEQIEYGMVSVVSYLTSYMTKGDDVEQFAGRRSYFPSTTLEKPIKKYGNDAIEYWGMLQREKVIKEKGSWTWNPEDLLQEIQFNKFLVI